jgi:ABC-type transport system substrate-binding protein
MKTAVEALQDWYAANLPMIPFYEKEIIGAQRSNVTGIYMDPQFAYTLCHLTLMNMDVE